MSTFNDFAVESPVDCTIFLKYRNENSFELKELLLTQALNYKISENKRPVYGFNKLDFSQVVRGKRLFEGVIVIKKSIISDLSKLIKIGEPNNVDLFNYEFKKLDYLKSILKTDSELTKYVDIMKDRTNVEYQESVSKLMNMSSGDILNDLDENNSLLILFGSAKQDQDFKYKFKEYCEDGKDISVTNEQLKQMIRDNSEFAIESVNFFEKVGEINVGSNDIDEVYKFFGKLKQWSSE